MMRASAGRSVTETVRIVAERRETLCHFPRGGALLPVNGFAAGWCHRHGGLTAIRLALVAPDEMFEPETPAEQRRPEEEHCDAGEDEVSHESSEVP